MAKNSSTAPISSGRHWHEVSLALLVGIISLGTGVFLVTVLQAPIGPPVEVVPLFVWNTTAASIALVLMWHENKYGYAAAIGTGGLVLLSLALIGLGVYGSIKPGSSPLGPLSYAGLATALIGTTIAAWRTHAPLQNSNASPANISRRP